MRSSKPNLPKNDSIQLTQEIKEERRKITTLCLKNTFQGIERRIKSQTIAKFISSSAKLDQQTRKIKFIAYFSQSFLKRKILSAFERLSRFRMHCRVEEKAVTILTLKLRRLQKGYLKHCFHQLKVTKSESKVHFHKGAKKHIAPLISPRMSESSEKSNILSVSEDSLSEEGFQDKKEYGHFDLSSSKKQNQQLKKMMLSNEARQSLLKLQRYNRFNYNTESEKILKDPIAEELKRLQKVKNQDKNMRSKIFDNELTITCLHNHIRMISEINQEAADSNTIKQKCAELEKQLADAKFQHKKEVNELKRKAMLGSRGRSASDTVPSQLVEEQKELFSQEVSTTVNILASALQAKKYKDIKRQIEHFITISPRQELTTLMKELLAFVQQSEGTTQQGREKQKIKIEILNFVNLIDKHLRAEKVEELESLKNKSKNQPHLNQLCMLLETLITQTQELKKLKRKGSSSDKFSSAQKERLKVNIEKQNQQLKRESKKLQLKNNELSVELQRLRQSLKKIDRVHPSLLPKKPTERQLSPADNRNEEALSKKIKQIESSYQKKIDNLQKQLLLKLENAKENQERLQNTIKKLQTELQQKDQSQKTLNGQAKQSEYFKKINQAVKEKINKKENPSRDINEFKRTYPNSYFLKILQDLQNEENTKQSISSQLKNILFLLNEANWKRKPTNLQLKQEGELCTNINQLIEIVLNLFKQKESSEALINEVDMLKKKQSTLYGQSMGLKEQISRLKEQVKTQKEEMIKIKRELESKQKLQSSNKAKTPERIQRSTSVTDKQLSDLKSENEKLKQQLQSIKKQQPSQQSLPQALVGIPPQQLVILLKECEDADKCLQNIQNSRKEKKPYQSYINTFKQKYSSSVFLDLFQILAQVDQEHCNVSAQLSSIVTAFTDGSWKKKANNLTIPSESEPQNTIHQLCTLLLTAFREKEENLKQRKELQNLRNTNSLIQKELSLLKQQNQKLQNQLNSLSKEPPKPTEKSLNSKQEASYQVEIQKLKKDLQERQAKITHLRFSFEQVSSSLNRNKQLDDFSTLSETIDSKLSQGLSYQQEVKDFKLRYPESIFRLTLDKLSLYESELSELNANLKNAVTYFLTNSWKTKPIFEIKSNKEYYQHLNQLVSFLLNISKQKEELASKDRKQTAQISSLQQQNDRIREELLNINKTSTTRLQNKDSKGQITTLRQKIADQTFQMNQLRLTNENLINQQQRINAELQNAIKVNAFSETEIETLNRELQMLKKEKERLKQTDSPQPSKDKQLFQLKSKLQETVLLLEKSQEKVNSYTVLFEKYKEERNNLYRMIEERDEEYELTKENEEKHIKQKQERDQKIFQLKQSYEQTQYNIGLIQREVEKLLTEKENLHFQRQSSEKLLKTQLFDQQQQIKALSAELQQKQRLCLELQSQLELNQIKAGNELNLKQNQNEYLKKEIQMLQGEIHQLKIKLQEERKELREKQQQLAFELTQERKFREDERNIFKQHFSQNSDMKLTTTATTLLLDDPQKLQLRKQLELANQEVATLVRKTQQEKRQLRQYIQQLNNQLQMQSVVNNEEKKILKEAVERARNEQYEIHHQKIRQMREDIQSHREQNQRLIAIIDSNETAFNELINEHRGMNQKITDLLQRNEQLTQYNNEQSLELQNANQEKESLNLKLRQLEENLLSLEQQIKFAINDKEVTQDQFSNNQHFSQQIEMTICQLQFEKRNLEEKVNELNRNNIELHKNILRLQSDLYKSVASRAPKESSGEYSRYLEDKLKQTQDQIKRFIETEKHLVSKIDDLMKTVSTLERQKMEYYSRRREHEIEWTLQKTNDKQDVILLQEKINKLEQELTNIENQSSKSIPVQNESVDISFFEQKIALLEQQNSKLIAEIDKLKRQSEQWNKQRTHLQIKIESYSQSNLENKLISIKYQDLKSQYMHLEAKLQAQENELWRIKKENQELSQSNQSDQHMQFLNQRTASLHKEEELLWLKAQLSSRQSEIQKLRGSEIELTNKLKRLQEKTTSLQHFQVRYNREVNSHEQTQRHIRNIEEFYKNQLQRIKLKEREAAESLILCNENLKVLNQSYSQLVAENKQLMQEAEKGKAESQALKEIVFQLDEDYVIEGDDELLELKILQKINQQISELLESNKKLKVKCQNLQFSIFDGSTQVSEQTFLYSLHTMTENLLTYLKNEHIINQEEVNCNLKQLLLDSSNNPELYLSNLEIFLKTLIISISKDLFQLQLSSNLKSQNIKKALENYLQLGSSQNLKKLREAL